MTRLELIAAIRAQILLMYPDLNTEITLTGYHILGIVSEGIDKIETLKTELCTQPKSK